MAEKEIADNEKKSAEKKRRTRRGPGKRVEALVKEVDTYKKQLEECQDKFLRLAADFDNFKKRTAREFSELMKSANEDLISQLIPVVDNFERALAAATSSADFDSFHKGVEMIYQQLKDMLQRQGVKEIEAVGLPFDPHRHEAVLVVEKKEHPPETVVEEVERGYMLNDRVLRPSKVAVNR
ncbi:MAG: nucleotide exchange factor GrpE [bacterium]